jgi:hypothetical protein
LSFSEIFPSFDHGARRITRGGEALVDEDFLFRDKNEISERAAGIYTDNHR